MAELLTMEETTEFLRVSRSTLERWVRGKQITSVKLGKRRHFRRSDLEAFVEQNARNQTRRVA